MVNNESENGGGLGETVGPFDDAPGERGLRFPERPHASSRLFFGFLLGGNQPNIFAGLPRAGAFRGICAGLLIPRTRVAELLWFSLSSVVSGSPVFWYVYSLLSCLLLSGTSNLSPEDYAVEF